MILGVGAGAEAGLDAETDVDAEADAEGDRGAEEEVRRPTIGIDGRVAGNRALLFVEGGQRTALRGPTRRAHRLMIGTTPRVRAVQPEEIPGGTTVLHGPHIGHRHRPPEEGPLARAVEDTAQGRDLRRG